MVVQLTIPVANVSDLIDLGFTKIEVWQSTDGGNLYNEITDSTAKPAVLTSLPAQTTFRMGNKLLKFKVDGGLEQSVLFSGVLDYWTPTQVANRINEVVPGLASVLNNSVLLTSPTTGRASSIEIIYNDALDLGFVAGMKGFGKAARLTLSLNTLIYYFPDVAGSVDDRYKWRFSADGSNPISEFSPRIFGTPVPVVSASKLSIGTAKFLSLTGQPEKRSIIIVSDAPPAPISGFAVGSQLPLIVESDDTGFLQVPLMRGAKVRVAIEGTAFVREFTVPNSATFDLLTVLAAAPDPFTIQTLPPFLVRRNIA